MNVPKNGWMLPEGAFFSSLPMWESISTIFSMLLGSMSGEVIRFSTARQTPSEVWMPMAVEPSWKTPHGYPTAPPAVTETL